MEAAPAHRHRPDLQVQTRAMARYLGDLPSRGLLTVQPGQLGYKQRTVAPKYISLRSTEPPDGQVVRTDPTNILIRSAACARGACSSVPCAA